VDRRSARGDTSPPPFFPPSSHPCVLRLPPPPPHAPALALPFSSQLCGRPVAHHLLAPQGLHPRCVCRADTLSLLAPAGGTRNRVRAQSPESRAPRRSHGPSSTVSSFLCSLHHGARRGGPPVGTLCARGSKRWCHVRGGEHVRDRGTVIVNVARLRGVVERPAGHRRFGAREVDIVARNGRRKVPLTHQSREQRRVIHRESRAPPPPILSAHLHVSTRPHLPPSPPTPTPSPPPLSRRPSSPSAA
jgi:hypothetical protein